MASPPAVPDSQQRIEDLTAELEAYFVKAKALVHVFEAERDEEIREIIRGNVIQTIQDAAEVKRKLRELEESAAASSVSGSVLLSIEEVRCFRLLELEDQLVAEGTLSVVKVDELTFIELDGFHFPLTREIPCLCTVERNFVLPFAEGVLYGLVLPEDVDESLREQLERTLDQTCTLQYEVMVLEQSSESVPPQSAPQLPSPESTEAETTAPIEATEATEATQAVSVPAQSAPELPTEAALEALSPAPLIAVQSEPQLSSKAKKSGGLMTPAKMYSVASAIDLAGERLAQKIDASSELLVVGIAIGGAYLQSRLEPLEEPLHIPPVLSGAVKAVAITSNYAVQIPATALSSLVRLAGVAGRYAAAYLPAIDQAGTSRTMEAMKQVGLSSVRSASQVWQTLHVAGQRLVLASRESSKRVIEHKYGEEAANLADDATLAVTNAASLYFMSGAMVRRTARKVAFETSRSTVKEYIAINAVCEGMELDDMSDHSSTPSSDDTSPQGDKL